MLKLKTVIQQLSEEEYKQLENDLNQTKAEKFLRLLTAYRGDNVSDIKLMQQLDVKSSAFYTLKSRLYDKLQDFLIENFDAPKTELIKKVANIPHLVYRTEKETAIASLTKLEKDLKHHDLPYELMKVYQALKKLHLHGEKYYDYSQAYNKHVAYTLAIDKMEDLVSDFAIKLGQYIISRDQSLIHILLALKEKATNVCKLYESHRLKVYLSVINITYALYVPDEEGVKGDEPIEDVLSEINDILSQHKGDMNYQFLKNIFCFFYFEYYHKFQIYKKSDEYFIELNSQLSSFLNLNFLVTPSLFFISKTERYLRLNKEKELYEEFKVLNLHYQPEKSDAINFFLYKKHFAIAAYYSGQYDVAVSHLNELRDEISLKQYGHAEIDVKLWLAVNYCMINDYDLAFNLLRSINRKAKEMEEQQGYEYDNVDVILKMLKKIMNSSSADEEKIYKLRNKFRLLNQSDYPVLELLKIDDDFIKNILKLVKTV